MPSRYLNQNIEHKFTCESNNYKLFLSITSPLSTDIEA